MKKRSIALLGTILFLIAPLAYLIVAPNAVLTARSVSILSGDTLFFSILAAFGLAIIYLIYRLIYVPSHHRSYIEYSASMLLLHLLAHTSFVIFIAGIIPKLNFFTSEISGAWIGILVIMSSILHISLDVPLYFSRANLTCSKAASNTLRDNTVSFSTALLIPLIMTLLIGAMIPSVLSTSVTIALILAWELFYLFLVQPILSKAFAR